ncbi:hypothetical protein Tco_0097769 [Tanacetum coccineum]
MEGPSWSKSRFGASAYIVYDLEWGWLVHCSKLLLEAGCAPSEHSRMDCNAGQSDHLLDQGKSRFFEKQESLSPNGVRLAPRSANATAFIIPGKSQGIRNLPGKFLIISQVSGLESRRIWAQNKSITVKQISKLNSLKISIESCLFVISLITALLHYHPRMILEEKLKFSVGTGATTWTKKGAHGPLVNLWVLALTTEEGVVPDPEVKESELAVTNLANITIRFAILLIQLLFRFACSDPGFGGIGGLKAETDKPGEKFSYEVDSD